VLGHKKMKREGQVGNKKREELTSMNRTGAPLPLFLGLKKMKLGFA